MTVGGASFIWWIFWNVFVYNSPETHPRIDPVEKNYIMTTVGTAAYEHVGLAHICHLHMMLLHKFKCIMSVFTTTAAAAQLLLLLLLLIVVVVVVVVTVSNNDRGRGLTCIGLMSLIWQYTLQISK